MLPFTWGVGKRGGDNYSDWAEEETGGCLLLSLMHNSASSCRKAPRAGPAQLLMRSKRSAL